MWECNYAKEPVDYKLCRLQYVKKIWIIFVAAALGAILFFGAHYLAKVVTKGGRMYQATSTCYLDFDENGAGEEYQYFNYFTWGQIIDSDYFADSIYDAMGGTITREAIREAVDASIESDVRFLEVRVNTHSKETSVRLANCVEQAMPGYAEKQKEIRSVEVTKKAQDTIESTNFRGANAAILGAVLGALAGIFGLCIYITLDTAVYIPASIEKRYKIPTLGAPCMKEYELNCKELLKEYKSLAVIPVEEDDFEKPEIFCTADTSDGVNPARDPENIDSIKNADAVILLIHAGRANDKAVCRCLEELSRLQIKVAAAILTGADEKLLERYYKRGL